MRDFFILSHPDNWSDRKFAEYPEGIDQLPPSIKCPKSIGHTRVGGLRTSKLFAVLPNCYDDIIWTWYGDCLVTNKVTKLLENHKITSYRLEQIVITKDKRKKDKPELKELIATGKGGHIHPSSGYKILEVCDACGNEKIQHAKAGLIVDESQWDHSDIFILDEYPKRILVTQRVKNLFEENKISGCAFQSAKEYKPIG